MDASVTANKSRSKAAYMEIDFGSRFCKSADYSK